MFERVVLGLDVGSYSVKAVELHGGLRGVKLVRCEEQPLPASPPEEREAALFAFARERNLPLEHVIAALPSDRVTQRHLRFPFTDPRRVAQAVPFELEDALPIPLEGAVLTWEAARSRDYTDVLAAVSPQGEVAAFLHELRQAGIEPRVLELDGAALANLSGSLPLADAPRLLLDVGHRKTNVILLAEGKPAALRSIPVAGRQLDEALAEDLRISVEAAAAHKHAHGVFEGPSAKPATVRVGRVLERLAREIRRTLESLSGDPLGGLAPGEILLVGGSSRLAGLAEWLGETLGLPCSRLEVPAGDPELMPLAVAGTPVFAQAAALALRGSATGRVTGLDFRRGDLAYTPDLAHLRRSAGLTAALAALTLVLWIGSLAIERAARERRARALESRIVVLYESAFGAALEGGDAFAALEQRARETRALASHLGVTDHGLSALEVLRELSARIPAELDVSLTELAVERRTIQARGYAKDFEAVDRVRAELARYEWFSEVRLTDVVSDPRTGGKTFNLTVRLAEDA